MIQPRANPDLFGQSRAWAVLVSSLRSGRIPHAWLLAGPRGIGKATLAYRFARALLAPPGGLDRAASEPDDPTFRQCAAGAHPDLVVVEPGTDPKGGRQKNEIGVDAVRAASRSLHRTTGQSGRRVFIVDGAELLNRNAVNALLKPLEEPPPGTVMLLVSHDPYRLLPTVRSRCAILRLARLGRPVIERILDVAAPDLGPAVRAEAARLAQGSAGRALELARSGLEQYRSLVLTLGIGPVPSASLHDLVDLLRARAEPGAADTLPELLQLLLARIVAVGSGGPLAPLFPEEPVALQDLADRRPLEQWPALWEKVAHLLRRADALNLDRNHVLLLVLSDLAQTPPEEARSPASLPCGGPHVVG